MTADHARPYDAIRRHPDLGWTDAERDAACDWHVAQLRRAAALPEILPQDDPAFGPDPRPRGWRQVARCLNLDRLLSRVGTAFLVAMLALLAANVPNAIAKAEADIARAHQLRLAGGW